MADFEHNIESDGEGEGFPEFMSSLEQHFTKLMTESARAPKDLMENMAAFSAAINWNEMWIRYLCAVHIALFLMVIVFRKNIPFQILVFITIALLVWSSEYINSLCHENWRSFSKQDYFDSNGLFAGVFFAGPLLFIGFIQLINMLIISSSMLIDVKKMELKAKKKAELKNADDVGPNTDAEAVRQRKKHE